MIKSISLENWKTHRETKMDFGKGTNVLIGIVGAGKSSVMDAICYGLFGTFPGLNAKKLSTDEVIMNSPNEMDYSKVQVEFFYKQNQYKVERILYRGKRVNEAKLYKNNEFFIGPKPSDVTEKIEELLEINFDLFSRAVYSEQNQIDYFLKLTPAQRKQKFDELLDLEKYETTRSNAVLISNRIKKNFEEKTNWIKDIEAKMNEKEILELKSKINAKTKELEAMQKKHSSIEEETIQLAKEISALQKLAQETKFLQEMEIRLSTREDELKKTLKRFEEEINEKIERYTIDYAHKMLQDLEMKQKLLKNEEEKIKEMQRMISSLTETKLFIEIQLKEKQAIMPAKNIEELNEKINTLLVQKVEQTKLLEKAQKEAKEISSKLSNLNAGIEVNESKNKELEESLKQLRVHAVCPICETGLNETKKKELLNNKEVMKTKFAEENRIFKQMLVEEKQRLSINEKQLTELSAIIAEIEKQRIELNEKKGFFTELNLLKQKIDSSSKEIEIKQNLYSIALKGFNQEAAKELILEQKRFEKVLEAIGKKEELNNLLKQSIEVKEKLKIMNFNEEYFEKLKNLHTKKSTEKETNTRELLSMQELITQMNKSIEAFEALKEQRKKIIEETISLKALHEKLLIFINSLKASQTELRELLVDTVNQAMDDIWPRIYPYKDFVSARIEIQENGDYELKVKQNSGKWLRVEGILSGGERSSAAICIRIAFSLVLTQNLSWLILDEPTHNLDAKSVKELSKMMKNHLPELVEQIFIITHDNEMEKAASGSLYMLERDKELQGATSAVLIKN